MEQNNTPLVVSVPCYRCNRYHRIVPLVNMLVIFRMGCYHGSKIIPQWSLHPLRFPHLWGTETPGTRGCNRPTVLYLPHLSLPSGRVLNPKPRRVCHKSMTHPFSQKTPTCKLLSCSLRKFSVLFTTKPKLSQARALSFCKKVVSLQKTL